MAQPKVDETPEPIFVFEKDRMIKKFNVDNYVTRAKIPPIDVPKRPPKKSPEEKLRERLATYHNVRKMRTDYKNYVRWYGEPPKDIIISDFNGNYKQPDQISSR
jgi:hypothetical protein